MWCLWRASLADWALSLKKRFPTQLIASSTGCPEEIMLASEALKDISSSDVEIHLEHLHSAYKKSRIDLSKLHLDCSVYPGEDDEGSMSSGDTVSYLLDHILRHSADRDLTAKKKTKRKPNTMLLSLVSVLTPEQLIGLLTVYSDRHGDREGVLRGAEILRNHCYPYRYALTSLRGRASGGQSSGVSRREKTQNRDRRIREAAAQLAKQGKAKHEVVGILAQRKWADGEGADDEDTKGPTGSRYSDGQVSARQIRRILKNKDAN